MFSLVEQSETPFVGPTTSPENRVSALLRARLRAAVREPAVVGLSAKAVEAGRLVPLLFHAAFDAHGLHDTPCRIHRFWPRRALSALARRYGLPGRLSRSGLHIDIAAVVGLPVDGTLSCVVVPMARLSPMRRDLLERRLVRVRKLLDELGLDAAVALHDPDCPVQAAERAFWPLSGMLLGGRLDPRFWATADHPAPTPSACETRARLTTVAAERTALALQCAPEPTAPLSFVHTMFERTGQTGFDSSGPLALCAPGPLTVAWAAAQNPGARLLLSAMCFGAPAGANARAVRVLAAHEDATADPALVHAQVHTASPGALLSLNARLASMLARAIQTRAAQAGAAAAGDPDAPGGPAPSAQSVRETWRAHFFGGVDARTSAVSPVLAWALAERFRVALCQQDEDELHWAVTPHSVLGGRAVRLLDPSGIEVARGPTMAAAQLRLASAMVETGVALPDALARLSHVKAAALEQPVRAPHVHVHVHARAVQGVPPDVLNRGPERASGLVGGAILSRAPGRRPRIVALGPRALVWRAVDAARAGHVVRVHAEDQPGQLVRARLERIVAFVQRAGEASLALEHAGRVWTRGALRSLGRAAHWRDFPAGHYSVRPRRALHDPEAPDLPRAVLAADRGPDGRLGVRPRVWLAVLPHSETHVSLCAEDTRGFVLRETVPYAELDALMAHTEAWLRAENRGTELARVRFEPDVMRKLERTRKDGPEPVEVTVHGTLPFGLEVEIRGERFGGVQPLGWRAACEAVAASWPLESDGRIRITDVNLDDDVQNDDAMLVLYARSVVRRRLLRQTKNMVAPYRGI